MSKPILNEKSRIYWQNRIELHDKKVEKDTLKLEKQSFLKMKDTLPSGVFFILHLKNVFLKKNTFFWFIFNLKP